MARRKATAEMRSRIRAPIIMPTTAGTTAASDMAPSSTDNSWWRPSASANATPSLKAGVHDLQETDAGSPTAWRNENVKQSQNAGVNQTWYQTKLMRTKTGVGLHGFSRFSPGVLGLSLVSPLACSVKGTRKRRKACTATYRTKNEL